MVNEVEVFGKIRKSPPPELDIKVRRGIRRLKVRRFAGVLSVVFIFAFSFGAALRLLLFRDSEVLQITSVSVKENLKESICPGVAPLKVEVEPISVYSYKVYLNGDIYMEGYTSKVIDDSIVINDPVNYINLQIVDLINGGEEDLSWFVYNF
ncbi:MAG: hypothetical protein QMD82_03780 [bacterium]|nr:hypothetical protein [bacterium]